ncbi:NAD(P)H-quinone oxidoreductase [Pseudokineococcus marinus]|uniref:NAD(P)H-quinone oxidoreductase n=1 Tax=Pseudokineococcus marinus TaxID=351215 RepID=A0A849BEN5_9ACTN|nr:NAD(P)H-quinone oxidoreductase [Pseudokineococcus marinus]NNH21499.1 NAD(P)H-quinone oxidoreductase [Pseudokineococcus marinus]
MRAAVVREPGGPDAIEVTEVPDPSPGPGEVVVEVAAAGVNRADVMQRQGHYPPPPGEPETLGLECSGTVAELGEGVEGWSVGDEVCALLAGGGYAERVVVPAGQLLPVPRDVSLVDAAALPEVACTVWSNVFISAGLREGELLLVHGGGSGIGTFAVQLARAWGARVAVTAGSARKLDACRELGAEVLVDYTQQDFVEEVRAATDGRGADVVLDVVGATYLERNVAVLAPNGRLVVIGMQGGRRAELDLGALLAKRAAVMATSLRARPREEKAAIVASVREHVWPLVEEGRVRPVVHQRMPLEDAARAHAVLEEYSHIGKVLLLARPGAAGGALDDHDLGSTS